MNYPFRYVPHPLVVDAANALISRIVADSALDALFSEGKMLGVLITDAGPLYAFSGLAGGKADVDGFVPPVLDLTKGYFKQREAEISAMEAGPAKSAASAALQDWIFENCRVMNGLGLEMSVKDIFALRGLVPPGGTGDCAAPKLLNYAFRNNLKPLWIGEFWYGASPGQEIRSQGRFYPACTGKCGPLLTWMMQGLDVEPDPLDAAVSSPAEPQILYADDTVLVVDKPAGMLSVPGRIESKSLLEWLRERFGSPVENCHRLDMDTSGIMVYARSLQAKSELERQFASREVSKAYRARLCGGPWNHALQGAIALPLSLDYYDRPRQMIDTQRGKRAVTRYKVLQIMLDGTVDVMFYPLTGRSHQIRVHAAAERGLGHPIVGDRLYGGASTSAEWLGSHGVSLMLRACGLAFRHPADGRLMSFGEGV